MIRINYSGTFKKSAAMAAQYNKQFIGTKVGKSGRSLDDKSRMIRQPHLTLMEKIAKCYAAQINNMQTLQPLQHSMPAFKTNNQALATKTGLSRMSVYNQLNRLISAGMIKRGKWGGTNGDYELIINTDCLYLLNNGNPVLPASIKNGVFTVAENQAVTNTNTKKVYHKESGDNIKQLTIADKIVDNDPNTQSIGQLISTISSFSISKESGDSRKQDTRLPAEPSPPLCGRPPFQES